MMHGTASLQINLLTGGSVICLYFLSRSSMTITSVFFSLYYGFSKNPQINENGSSNWMNHFYRNL